MDKEKQELNLKTNELKLNSKLPSQTIVDRNISDTLLITLILGGIIMFISVIVTFVVLSNDSNPDLKYIDLDVENINPTISVEKNCVDSDYGKDIYVKGTAQNQFETHIDQCGQMIGTEDNTFILYEAWCADNDGIGVDRVECQNGCLDGACINNNSS